ncbi:MAG: HD domain-containing phosphohydrolase [Chloroflexota bacterium]
MREKSLCEARILIVDDLPGNVDLLECILHQAGYADVLSTTDPRLVSALQAEFRPDLILLDLHMPHLDGLQVLERLGPAMTKETYLPVLVLTGDSGRDAKQRALTLGAKDFLTKPFDRAEVVLRIKNLLETRFLYLRLEGQNQELEAKVRQRTQELEAAQFEILDRLALATEYRDDVTGGHAQRVGRLSALLAEELGLPDEWVQLIRRAALLHDVGKIGIPDDILLKPGKYTPAEFARMQTHTSIGARIVSGSRLPLLRMAEEIARTHHERWDGGGYGSTLRGEGIPLSGRIVAVADVFDALTHARPYKPAWPLGEAVAEMVLQGGRQFDPAVVEAFVRILERGELDGLAAEGSIQQHEPAAPLPLAPSGV